MQTGVRIDRDLLKVLKGMAELYEISLGELFEGVLLHALEGRSPFGSVALERITTLCEVYGLELGADDFDVLRRRLGPLAPVVTAPAAAAAAEPRPTNGSSPTPADALLAVTRSAPVPASASS